MARRADRALGRAERIEHERRLAEAARRKQRLARLAGLVVSAAVVIVAVVVISASHNTSDVVRPGTRAAKADDARVDTLLAGIAESADNTLGASSAPVTVTEFGDLECSVCDDFALATTVSTSDGASGSGVEDQLISTYVRTGRARLVYRSLDTATSAAGERSEFPIQQAAALAAGLQQRAWYYIELFYNEQGQEGSGYVTESYLDGLAKQIPGLDYREWLSARHDPSLTAQVSSDETSASRQGLQATPSIVISGPKGRATPIQGVPSWSQLQSAIRSVS